MTRRSDGGEDHNVGDVTTSHFSCVEHGVLGLSLLMFVSVVRILLWICRIVFIVSRYRFVSAVSMNWA